MWIAGGCRGRFVCGDPPSMLVCGFPRQSPKRKNCTCGVADPQAQWPTRHETAAALRSLPPAASHEGSWLGAIISGSITSDGFKATALAIGSCGFVPVHVPAAMPEHYGGLQAMMLELFGRRDAHAVRMSAHEIGLVISHKRALAIIADGNTSWGAVFEDDAYLHENLLPSQARAILERAWEAADESTVLYLGSCSPRCADGAAQTTTLGRALLRSGRCHAYCTHAYGLSRRRALSFFAEVFGCQDGPAKCGRDCEKRACFADWAMTRHFRRADSSPTKAWIVGGGLRSESRPEHRGLFLQNRSSVVTTGTSLGKQYRWSERARCQREAHGARRPLERVLVTTRWSGRLGNLLFECVRSRTIS